MVLVCEGRESRRQRVGRCVVAGLTEGCWLREIAPESVALEEAIERRAIDAGETGRARRTDAIHCPYSTLLTART